MARELLVVAAALLVVAGAANVPPAPDQLGTVLGNAVTFLDQCGDRGISVCLKERALKYLDTVSGNIELTEGVTLKATEHDKRDTAQSEATPAELPKEARESEATIDRLLMDRISEFLSSHTLEFRMPKAAVAEMKRNIDADEGRRKKKKMLLPLLLLLKLKAVALLPIFLGVLALISFKALVVGKVALVITGLIALKKLFEGKEASQTYEVVAHPHHTHSHVTSFGDDHHHHGHYRRALVVEDPQNIPYSAYVGNQQLMFGNE